MEAGRIVPARPGLKPEGRAEMATNSDRVREYVFNNYVLPARQRGQKHVDAVAGEVANAMKLTERNSMGLVCDALTTLKFQNEHGIALVKRAGSGHGANTVFTFSL